MVLTRATLNYEVRKKTLLSLERHCSTRTMEARKRARVRDDVEIELSSENESRSESDSVVLSSTYVASSSSDSDIPASTSGPSTSTRRGRRAKAKELYLQGRSRKPYRRAKDLQCSFEDTQSDNPSSSNPAITLHFEPSDWNDNVCKSCAPISMKYSWTFKGMKRQGTELKRCKSINPHPKQPAREQYRDLVKQNEWLRNNVYDSLGNYLFCSRCVHHALGVSYQRLSRQRSNKRCENSEPIRSMTKAEVEEERLGKYVIMPQGCELSFMAWWKQLASTAIVNVRYPHHHHGNSGKPSHSAKKDAKSDFLTFVDANSQPIWKKC